MNDSKAFLKQFDKQATAKAAVSAKKAACLKAGGRLWKFSGGCSEEQAAKVGAVITGGYSTIRAGYITRFEVVATQVDNISPAVRDGMTGQYDRSSVNLYRSWNGVLFSCGGGGPSDGDTLKIVKE